MQFTEKFAKNKKVLVFFLLFMVFLIFQANAQTCIQPPAGLISWWPGDGNPNDIVDGNHGILMNGATFGQALVGQAFLLDGIDDFVDLGNASNLHVSTGDFTVDAWVNFASLGSWPQSGPCYGPGCDMSIVDKMSCSRVNIDGWRLLKQSDNRFWFCFGGGALGNRCDSADPTHTVVSNTVVVPGVWYHVAAVKSSTAFSIYVNGVMEHTGTLGPFTDTHSTNLVIGSYVLEGSHLNGLVDEVEIFNRALSASEIAGIYNAGIAGKCKETFPLYDIIRDRITVFPGGPDGTWDQFKDQYQLESYYPESMKKGEHVLEDGFGATFIPNFGYTLSEAANILGFEHFNWKQWYGPTDPQTGRIDLTHAEIDPPKDCYPTLAKNTDNWDWAGEKCITPNRDSLPWYLDEQFSISGVRIYDDSGNRVNPCTSCTQPWEKLTRREQWTLDSNTLLFSDSPTVEPTSFLTCLAGVSADNTGNIFDSTGNFTGSNSNSTCFYWTHLASGSNVGGGSEESGSWSDGFSVFLGFVESGVVLNELLPLLAKEGIGISTPDGFIKPVTLDIKPGDLPNSLNPKSKGVIPVVILTTDTFDATSVDPLTVRFGPNEASEVHARGHIEDVNGDGKPDLVLHFNTQSTGIQCGDTSAVLKGKTFDGESIAGSDSIRTTGCVAR